MEYKVMKGSEGLQCGSLVEQVLGMPEALG